jgi:hypothetical protein
VKTLGTWDYKGGRLIKRTNGNGTWVDVSYDSRKLPTSVAHKRTDSSTTENILTAEYAYDSAGHVTTEGLKHYLNNGSLHQDKGFTFLYDKAYRLTKSYREVPAAELGQDPPTNYATKVEYTLDANGNRATVASTPKGGSTSSDVYTANSTNAYSNVTWAGDSEGFGYDLTGDRTSAEDSRSWQYDFDHHLVALEIEETEHSAYLYDALGRRIEKQFQYNGLEYEYRKRFFYAGGSLIQEYDVIDDYPGEAVRLEIEYFWGAAGAEPVYIRKYDPDLSTLEQEGYYHQNAQGSVYALTGVDAAANILETYRYSEFGELQHIYAADTTSGIAASFGNKWFHGCRYYDHEVTYVASGQALYNGSGGHGFDPEQNASISRVDQGAANGNNPDPSDLTAHNDPDHFGGAGLTPPSTPWRPTRTRQGDPSTFPDICSPDVTIDIKLEVCTCPCGPRGTKSELGGSLGDPVPPRPVAVSQLNQSIFQSSGFHGDDDDPPDPIFLAVTCGQTVYIQISAGPTPPPIPPLDALTQLLIECAANMWEYYHTPRRPGLHSPSAADKAEAEERERVRRREAMFRELGETGWAMAAAMAGAPVCGGGGVRATAARRKGSGGNPGSGFGGRAPPPKAGSGGKPPPDPLPRFDGQKPKYFCNPEHVRGPILRPGKTPLPPDAEDAYKRAVPDHPTDPRCWYALGAGGAVYRYSVDRNGTSAHFSGASNTFDGIRNITQYAKDRLGVNTR